MGTGATDLEKMAGRLAENIGKVIVGKREAIDLALTALLCEGHVLVEDVPGIGKTLLAKSIARSLDCSFRRIQCTPDLLPSDVTGSHFYNQGLAQFEFRAGPLMANIVLADELNRATPRTQSSLLEAMQERQITVDGETHELPRPFLVIATQNPVELEGTFPLPEAQLDRFLLKIRLGYPTQDEESAITKRFEREDPLSQLEPLTSVQAIMALQRECRRVQVADVVRDYLIAVVRATREHSAVRLGASPRATLGLLNAAQVWAAIHGREFVIPDDGKRLAAPVLSHRLILKPQARLRGQTSQLVVDEVLAMVPVPVEKVSA